MTSQSILCVKEYLFLIIFTVAHIVWIIWDSTLIEVSNQLLWVSLVNNCTYVHSLWACKFHKWNHAHVVLFHPGLKPELVSHSNWCKPSLCIPVLIAVLCWVGGGGQAINSDSISLITSEEVASPGNGFPYCQIALVTQQIRTQPHLTP